MVTSFFSAPRYAVIEYRWPFVSSNTGYLIRMELLRIGMLIDDGALRDALFCLDQDAETGRAAQIYTSTGP